MDIDVYEKAKQRVNDPIEIYVSSEEFHRLLEIAESKKPLSENIKMAIVKCDEGTGV